MAKGKKKTTLWVVLAAVILAIFALGKLGGSEPGTTARQTTAAVTETTVQTTDTTPEKQTADSAKAKTAAKKKQTAAKVPAFSGKPYVVLDDNQPRFSAKDKKRRSAYETYAPLDSLGRCGVAFACVCKETMPTEKRGEIGQVRPSGWHTVKYDTVDGKYLYNRCHLIGYQLSAENANTRNLITGTRYLNTQGMLPFENLVADYIKETGNHVLYRWPRGWRWRLGPWRTGATACASMCIATTTSRELKSTTPPATATPQMAVPAPLIVRNPINKHPKRCRCGRLGCCFD